LTDAAPTTFREIGPLRQWLAAERAGGRRIGLVPTMGALHEGHLALVDAARTRADSVVLSIFVNPLQFGPHEDFQRYPRDLARDSALAAGRGVRAVFAPAVETMYPPGSEVRIEPGRAAIRWEGAVRPGHFVGVLTVVSKLFHIVQPDVAVFGQKDIQQATLIQALVRDLDFPLELVVNPTVREPDGLALSSRNAYLTVEDRARGLVLSRALRTVDRAWREGNHDGPALTRLATEQFDATPGVTPDYIAVVDPIHLEPVMLAQRGTIIALAARVGGTRLLDNHILGMEFR